MSEDTGIASVVDQLHTRLREVRQSARNAPPTVEELLPGWEQAETQNSAASVSEAEPQQESKVDDQRILVTPPPKEAPVDEGEASEPAAREDPAGRQCRECGKLYHADFPDDEHPDLCEECIVSKSEAPAPTTEWRRESPGRLGEAILDVLHEVYPQELSASEIADRLPARNIEPSDANRSSVNSELYGPLRDWLTKKGRRPPVWAFEPAKEITEGTSDSDSEKMTGRSQGGDGTSFETSAAGSAERDLAEASEQKPGSSANGFAQEGTSPEECPICSKPMEESHEWRNERMCSACYEALKDI